MYRQTRKKLQGKIEEVHRELEKLLEADQQSIRLRFFLSVCPTGFLEESFDAVAEADYFSNVISRHVAP